MHRAYRHVWIASEKWRVDVAALCRGGWRLAPRPPSARRPEAPGGARSGERRARSGSGVCCLGSGEQYFLTLIPIGIRLSCSHNSLSTGSLSALRALRAHTSQSPASLIHACGRINCHRPEGTSGGGYGKWRAASSMARESVSSSPASAVSGASNCMVHSASR